MRKTDTLLAGGNAMAVGKEDLYRLIDQITDPIELETAYRAIDSIIKHDEQSWYWTQGWQAGGAEAERDKAEGPINGPIDRAEDLFEHLRQETMKGVTPCRLMYSWTMRVHVQTDPYWPETMMSAL